MEAEIDESIIADLEAITRGAISAEIAQSLRNRVLDVCRRGGTGNPLGSIDEVQIGKTWSTQVILYLLQKEWFLPAKSLLYELWDNYAAIQRASKCHVSRALISQLLTEVCYREKSQSEAFRWSLLTQADDILGEHGSGGGHGKHWLYGIFGLSSADRASFDSIAEKCRVEAEKSGWDKPAGFAEEVLRVALQHNQVWRSIVQRHALAEEFHLTPKFLTSLLEELRAATSNHEKGTALESTAYYLFSLMAGCVPQPNLLDVAGASEHDLVVSNLASTSNLTEAIFGRDFLVECKNWNKPVGVQEVGYFLFRLSLTHCRFGVMLSSAGATSAEGMGEAHAESIIRRAFHENGTACVVVSMSELEDLASGTAVSLTGLLINRLNEFRFGKSKCLT